MNKEKRRKIGYILIFVLFAATFNDILRIVGTKISIYRIIIPLIVVLSLMYFKYTWKFYFVYIALLFVNMVQNIVFLQIYEIDEVVDWKWQLTYLFHYFAIFIIFIVMRLVNKLDHISFERIYSKLFPVLGGMCLFIYFITLTPWYEKLSFANPNNYAVALATVFPWFYISFLSGKKRNILICVLIMAALVYGDSKAALCGVFFQLGLISALWIGKQAKDGNKYIYLFFAIVCGFCIFVCLSPITINGYQIRNMFTEMFTRIVKNEPYLSSRTSLGFRTNAIIYLLRAIVRSFGIGVGIGNSGKILREAMPDVTSTKEAAQIALSSHNALLEFISDCGIWAIVLCVFCLVYAFKKIGRLKRIRQQEIYLVTFTVSLPIWIMSASGVYTIYMLFIVSAWLYEWCKEN